MPLTWERLLPPTPCVSPDGHFAVEIFMLASQLPVRVLCARCNADYGIAVFEAEPA